MALSLPAALSSLTAREGIADALYRIVESLDNNDFDLLKSATSGPDVSLTLDGNVFDGLGAIRTHVLAVVGPMDTFHTLSNLRVDLKDDSTAVATAYGLAQHCPPGRGAEPDGPKYLAASRYFAELVKDKSGGLWKIANLKLKVIWAQGDRSVMLGHG